ncbi:MAG TPA: DUF4252 domain-containing protein [Thermoanaerobaculia bacterium]|nr:DUF4252 domain-containing protein [Thermoanaerobaculia bacterium]
MKRLAIALIILAVASGASAQQLNLDIPGLEERASEVVDVTLDASMLRLASKFLSSNDPDERGVREMVQKLQGIYVRSYEFDRDGEYERSAIDRVRTQLGPAWKKIVNVRSKKSDNVEIYTLMRGDAVNGLLIISAEPRELTIVNIVGPVDLEKLANLEGQFGIPRMSTREKDKKEDRQ